MIDQMRLAAGPIPGPAIASSLINPLGFYKAKPWPFSGPLTIATTFEADSRFARSGAPLRRGESVQGPADPTSAVLQYCASGADKFYLITTASQTVTASTRSERRCRSRASRDDFFRKSGTKKPGRNGRAF
jgi:hypothetical protein